MGEDHTTVMDAVSIRRMVGEGDGGHAVRGEISADTHPDYVEGPGRMYVKMYGLTITIR